MKKKSKILLLFICMMILACPVKTEAKISLNKTSVIMTAGKSYKLKLKGTKSKVKWSSKKKSIASVSKKGVVKGKKAGSTYVYAKIKNKKYKCKIKVEAPRLSSASITLKVGDTFKLHLYNCSRIKSFSSSNPSVVSTDNQGLLVAKTPGFSQVTVQIPDAAFIANVIVTDFAGTNEEPKNPYNTFTSELYRWEEHTGNITIRLLEYKEGDSIKNMYAPRGFHQPGPGQKGVYLKFYIKNNLSVSGIECANIIDHKNNFFISKTKQQIIPDDVCNTFFDSVPKLSTTILHAGESIICSQIYVVPNDLTNLTYRIQTVYDPNGNDKSCTWFKIN